MKNNYQDEVFKATYYSGINAISCDLCFHDGYIVFRPMMLNFGNKDLKQISITEIYGYKKGILGFLFLYLKNGMRVKLVVYHKEQIIQEIKVRRKAVFEELNQEPSELVVF